jgi:hypothetical protein
MRHFLFEEKEYRIRAVFRRRRESADAMETLARLLRGKRSGGVRRGADLRQNCVAKMQYSSSIEAHRVQLEKYLAREGTDIDGSAAKLFGTDGGAYRANMVEKNFRIFLSPQNPEVDLKTLAGKFIKKLEKQTGYRLFWQGACHYNTAHPHAHLLINGRDHNGREVFIPRDIVKTFMREAARDLCTAQLGRRTQKDLDLDRERELSAPRLTRLDGRIEELCAGTDRVNTKGTLQEKERVLARLQALRALKLCVYENGGYRMKKDWQEDLKANGRYNAFLAARGELRYGGAPLKVYTGEQGEVSGRVTKIYKLDDDASDNHAVLLEGLDGRSWFVPLLKKPQLREGAAKTALAEGELVTLKTYAVQQGRLTPFFFRQSQGRARGMVKRNAYTGKLAEEIITGAGLKSWKEKNPNQGK